MDASSALEQTCGCLQLQMLEVVSTNLPLLMHICCCRAMLEGQSCQTT
jgi:hypothetical protein